MSASPSPEAKAPPPEWIAQFVDEIPTGIAVFDRELRYVAANTPWVDTFGLATVSLAGQRHHDLDQLGGARLSELQQRALSGESINSCDTLDSDAGGQRRRAISVRPRLALDGAIVGVIAALHEITPEASDQTPPDTSDRLTGIPGRQRFLARLRAA